MMNGGPPPQSTGRIQLFVLDGANAGELVSSLHSLHGIFPKTNPESRQADRPEQKGGGGWDDVPTVVDSQG